MFKKNTAVTGFSVGLVSATDGSDITTGTPVGYYTLDGGTQTAIGDVTPAHEGNGLWSFDLLAAETNGDIVALSFTHASAITAHFTIKTDTKIVSELQDITTAQVNTECDTALTDYDGPTDAEMIARTLVAGSYFDPAADTVATVTTLTNKTGFSLAATGLDAISSTATGMIEIAKAIWDRVISKANHNIAQSSGKLLRNLAATTIRQDTAQGAGTGNNQIQLDTGASAIHGAYDPSRVSIVDGTGAGQSRLVLQYDGITKICTVDRDWKVNPDDTSEYLIEGDTGREHVNEGLAQGGTLTTITLNALASSKDNAYRGQTIFIRSGFAADQAGLCLAYDGATKIATIAGVWVDIPNATSAYVMLSTSLYDDTAVSNITTGAAAPSVAAESRTLTTGTEVNTYTATHELDGVHHEVSDAAGNIDIDYQFDIGNDNIAGSKFSYCIHIIGRLYGNGSQFKQDSH